MTDSKKEVSATIAVPLKASVRRHAALLQEMSETAAFTVFLCGPTLNTASPDPAAKLRKRIIEELQKHHFEVVLGEDDGLEEARLKFGLNAQDNELEFIKGHCNAVIIIASSVGSFCELGLFSWHYVHKDGHIDKELPPAFIVLVDEKYKSHKSYLNEGPISAVDAFGHVCFVDYDTYDLSDLIKRLSNRRSIQTIDRRGRPRGANT